MSKAAKPKKGMGSLRKLKEYNAWLKNEIRYYEMLVEKANNLIASKNNDLKTLNEMFQNQQGLLYVLIRRTGGTIVVTPNEWKVGIGQGVRVKADPFSSLKLPKRT